MNIKLTDNGFCFYDSDIEISLKCFEQIHGVFKAYELPNRSSDRDSGLTYWSGTFHESGAPAHDGIRNIEKNLRIENDIEIVDFIWFGNAPGLAWRRILKPKDRTYHLASIYEQVTVSRNSWLYPSSDTFCFHAENPRMYDRYCMGVLEDRTEKGRKIRDEFDKTAGTFWIQSRHYRKEVGRSPYQPFPAMIYGNHEGGGTLLEGSLTQQRLYRHYDVQKIGGEYVYIWTQAPKTVNAVVVDEGKSFTGEWNYLEFQDKKELNHPYDGFVNAMENITQGFRGANSDNRKYVAWGSYNCGVFVDFDQDRILQTADYITENMPGVKWIQIDAGYDAWDYEKGGGTAGCAGIGTAYEDPSFSSEKFPMGMKYFTDELKKRGLRPALWVGLYVGITRKLYVDHPEWFVSYGTELGCGILDISRKDVQEYIVGAYEKFIGEWGFEGVKFDFWSYIFEEEAIPLPAGKMTGTEYRTWYMKTVRDMLPEYGYIQTGCDIAMANPHLGLYADNYRYGKDIGSGQWESVLMNARWAAFCVNTHSGRLFVPNSDAVGIMPGLSDADMRTHINFCLISRTLVEVAGWLHKDKDHSMMPFIKKACCCPKNGEDVFFGDFDFAACDDIPPVWYLKSPHFSRIEQSAHLPVRTFVVFNWDNEEEKQFVVTCETLGLEQGEYIAKDYWSDSTESLQNLEVSLKPRESRMFSVFDAGMKAGVVDSDCLVQELDFNEGILNIKALCAGRNEIVLRGVPKSVKVQGCEIDVVKHDEISRVVFESQGESMIAAEY